MAGNNFQDAKDFGETQSLGGTGCQQDLVAHATAARGE